VAGADAMSVHQAFRRVPVPAQVQAKSTPYIIPAPTRGIVQSENYTFMQPGAAIIQDNWVSTMRGVKLRGGFVRWCDLHAGVPVPDPSRLPIISGFEYLSANVQKMYAANATTLFDVSAATPIIVKSGQHSGNYSASQLSDGAGDYLMVVNDAGDPPLRFNGTAWTTLNSGQITGPPGSAVVAGANLCYVWKYRNRYFFIEVGSMNAWYLGIDSIQGALSLIPLSGAATKGGKLLFGATWSIDAGDGIDDKCCFFTTEGEVLVFTGSNPADAANWRQEGRYQLSKPMGMNAHMQVGGDLLIATVDGIIPLSQAITKTAEQLELAAITRTIKPLWRTEVDDKSDWNWTMKKWDEYGGIFVTTPGDPPGKRHCLVANSQTNAWCRFLGYDATCWMTNRGSLFFGTQDGIVMQADRTGYDDGMPYVATLVGGWEMFQSPPVTVVWKQARAVFTSGTRDPFIPQLAACTDYQIRVPHPPPAGPDLGVSDVWDQGEWDVALWDQPSLSLPSIRSTGWVSIGETGFSHAPIVQTTIAQQARPNVELISISAMYERVGVNV